MGHILRGVSPYVLNRKKRPAESRRANIDRGPSVSAVTAVKDKVIAAVQGTNKVDLIYFRLHY